MQAGDLPAQLNQPPILAASRDLQVRAEELPAHRHALADGWSVWRQSCLRSAGFPDEPLAGLRAPRSSARLEIVMPCQATLESARSRALDYCRQQTSGSDAQHKRLWRRRRRGLKHARPTVPDATGDPMFAARCRDVRTALAELDSANVRFELTFAAETRQRDSLLADLAVEPRFREALAWQNRALLNRIGALSSRGSNPRARNKLALALMHYWYRYRKKNESIGFFGPVAWTAIADDGHGVSLAPGAALLAHRDVPFEYWALDRICATFAHRGRGARMADAAMVAALPHRRRRLRQ